MSSLVHDYWHKLHNIRNTRLAARSDSELSVHTEMQAFSWYRHSIPWHTEFNFPLSHQLSGWCRKCVFKLPERSHLMNREDSLEPWLQWRNRRVLWWLSYCWCVLLVNWYWLKELLLSSTDYCDLYTERGHWGKKDYDSLDEGVTQPCRNYKLQ